MAVTPVDGLPPRTFVVLPAWLPRAAVSRRTLKPDPAAHRATGQSGDEGRRGESGGSTSVRVHRPAAKERPVPALLWIHGGGYVLGTAAQRRCGMPALRRRARDHRCCRRLPAGAGNIGFRSLCTIATMLWPGWPANRTWIPTGSPSVGRVQAVGSQPGWAGPGP